MVDYVADVKKYVPAPNEKAVAGIVKHFGIAMREGSDSSYVSASDKEELARVRTDRDGRVLWHVAQRFPASAGSPAELTRAAQALLSTLPATR